MPELPHGADPHVGADDQDGGQPHDESPAGRCARRPVAGQDDRACAVDRRLCRMIPPRLEKVTFLILERDEANYPIFGRFSLSCSIMCGMDSQSLLQCMAVSSELL